MRPIEFVFNLIDKFSPMEETERSSLRMDANADYVAVKREVFDDAGKIKPEFDATKATWKQKAVKVSERWEVRMIFALAFIFVSKSLRDYIEKEPEAEYYDDDDFDEYED